MSTFVGLQRQVASHATVSKARVNESIRTGWQHRASALALGFLRRPLPMLAAPQGPVFAWTATASCTPNSLPKRPHIAAAIRTCLCVLVRIGDDRGGDIARAVQEFLEKTAGFPGSAFTVTRSFHKVTGKRDVPVSTLSIRLDGA
jgi:hypothetical protein